jgi:hypothetical protein
MNAVGSPGASGAGNPFGGAGNPCAKQRLFTTLRGSHAAQVWALAAQAPGDVPAGATIAYALTSDGVLIAGRGHRVCQLRDSDPFVWQVTGAAQPNHAVAFQLNVP